MTPNGVPARDHLYDIDRGKGIGILLVVYGHLVMQGTLNEQAWYAVTKSSIYLFHMPFFMYLSGYIFHYTGAIEALSKNYARFLAKRADRLLVPFVLFGTLVVLAKAAASRFVHVDDPVNSISSGFYAVISNSSANPSISIWYLFVLFIFSIVTPLLWVVFRRNALALLIFSLAIFFIPVPESFYLGRIMRFFVFFVVGINVRVYWSSISPIFKKYLIVFIIFFAILLFIGRAAPYALLLCGLTSIPAIHGICNSKLLKNDRFILWIGQNSMSIYLLNTIFIGMAKVAWVRIFPTQGPWFIAMVIFLMLAGTFLPLVVRYTVDKLGLRWISKYLR